MDETCRLCGLEDVLMSSVDIEHEKLKELLDKFGILLENNENLPKSCCASCVEYLQGFCRYLDNIGVVQRVLEQKIKQEKPETVDTEEESQPRNKSRESKKRQKKAGKVKRKTKKTEIRKKPKEEEDAVARYFHEELSREFEPFELLDTQANELNEDGSLNELGMQRMDAFSWSDFMWSCTQTNCELEFGTVQELTIHYKFIHETRPVFKCPECSKTFRMLASCVNHFFEHKPIAKFCCAFCSLFFCNVLKLYKHQKSVHERVTKLCLYCGKHFFKPSDLRDHRENHPVPNQRPLYTCDICQKMFRIKEVLKSHMLIHIQGRPHICDVCGKDFPKKQYLDTHLLVHQSAQKHKCPICHRGFKTSCNLKRHSAIHKPVKDVICSECGKAFNSKQALKNHSRVHTDERPYACEDCNKRFKHYGVYRDHKRIHTGERPYSCTVCTSTFAGYPNYSKHMKIHGIFVAKLNKPEKGEEAATSTVEF